MHELIPYLEKNGYEYEVVIVDDGSTDRTADIAAEFMRENKRISLLRSETNRGKGFSVKRGMLAARKEFVLFSDADKSTPADEIEHLFEYTDDYDVVIGSRGLKESNVMVRQPLYKALMGKLGNRLIRFLATPGIMDTQCGFKLFRKSALFVFEKQTIDRWGFDFEILFIAGKHNLKIKEVPVAWSNDADTKLKFRDYFRTFLELLTVRINDLAGKYD